MAYNRQAPDVDLQPGLCDKYTVVLFPDGFSLQDACDFVGFGYMGLLLRKEKVLLLLIAAALTAFAFSELLLAISASGMETSLFLEKLPLKNNMLY